MSKNILTDGNGNEFYPETKTKNVTDDNGDNLDNILNNILNNIPKVPSWALSSVKPVYSYVEIVGTPTSLPANGGNSNTVKNRDVCEEIDDLKQNAINFKQEVVNEINSKNENEELTITTPNADVLNALQNLQTKNNITDLINFSNKQETDLVNSTYQDFSGYAYNNLFRASESGDGNVLIKLISGDVYYLNKSSTLTKLEGEVTFDLSSQGSCIDIFCLENGSFSAKMKNSNFAFFTSITQYMKYI